MGIPLKKDGTLHLDNNRISAGYYVTKEEATEEFPSGFYYCDECSQIHGPYDTHELAMEGLKEYIKNM